MHLYDQHIDQIYMLSMCDIKKQPYEQKQIITRMQIHTLVKSPICLNDAV